MNNATALRAGARATARRMGGALAALALAASVPAWAGDASPRAYGQTIGNWGHTWWQWAASFPAGREPMLGDGSINCGARQIGEVWFLAGNWGGTAVRTCSVKKGKALFFPIFNGVWWTPLDPSHPEDCTDLRSCRGVSGNIDRLTAWSCTLDASPCVWSAQVVRAQSDPRPFIILPNSAFTAYESAPGVPYGAGIRRLSIADGYWVMLDPLPPGPHTLRFTATAPGFGLDVTYNLTIE